MSEAIHQPPVNRRTIGDRWFWGLLIGAFLLLLLAILAIPFAGRRPTEFAPLSAPEGVVERFFASLYQGDYTAAYAMLDDQTQADLSLSEFQQRMRYERESEMRIDDVVIHTDTASVTVTLTHFSPGGLFGGNEWRDRYDLLLERSDETWKIVGSPFW